MALKTAAELGAGTTSSRRGEHAQRGDIDLVGVDHSVAQAQAVDELFAPIAVVDRGPPLRSLAVPESW